MIRSMTGVLLALVLLGGCTATVSGEASRDSQARSPWCQELCDGLKQLLDNKTCASPERDRDKFADCVLWLGQAWGKMQAAKKVLDGQPKFGDKKLAADALAAMDRAMVGIGKEQCSRTAVPGLQGTAALDEELRVGRCKDSHGAAVSALQNLYALVSSPGW